MSAADDAMGGGGGGYDIFVVEVHAAKQLREVQSLLDQDVYAVATVTPGAAGGPKQRTGTVQDDFVDRAELDLATLNRQPVDRPSSSMGQAVLCERGTRPTPRDCFPSPGRAPVPRRRVGPRKIWHFLRPFMIFYDIPDIALLEKPMICVWPLNLSSKRSRCGRPDPPKPLIEHCGFLQQIQTSLVTEKRQSNNW